MENFRLKVFRTVAEHLSFRRAGEQLGLTQPAVTLQIQTLEEELSVRLLDRSGNRVSLTPAGRILLKHANAIADQVAEAQEELAALSGDHVGELRIGASTSIAQYVLPKLLGRFQRQVPRVRISVISGNTEEIVKHLTSERINIGLIEGPALSRDVRTEAFLEDELVLVMPAKHDWAVRPFLAIDQLKGQPLLLREHGSGTRRVLEMALEKAGIKRQDLNVVMELDSTEAILSSVEAELGIGFVTHWAVLPRLPLGRIKTAPVRGLRISRNFSLLYPAGPKPVGIPGAFRRFALEYEYPGPK
jgi:DNA-binding transcriptional LysR family regulator